MFRPTKNFLLIKDEVGRAKQGLRDLPSFGHTYGKPFKHDPEGAYEVTSQWVPHRNSSQPRANSNFRAANKLSLANKITTSRAISQFRRTKAVNLPVL